MSLPRPADDPSTCWQCGAPADPACTYRQHLNAWAKDRLGGLGLDVIRGRRQDAVYLPIPRCAKCMYRNWLSYALVLVAAAAGYAAGSCFGPWPWMRFVGAAGAFAALALNVPSLERLMGHRPIVDHPRLKGLLAEGWFYPD